VIDLETIQSTDSGTRFHQAIAVLLGIIAVLAAGLSALQMDRSQDEARATTAAARLTADLAAAIPIQGIGFELTYMGFQTAIARQAEGATRRFVSLGVDDAAVAEGAAEEAAGHRLQDIATAMGAPPDATTGLPPYELRLLTSEMAELQSQVAEQNRVVDVDVPSASADSGAAVAGLSLLALAGVLVGLASVVGASRAARVMLLMAAVTTGAAAVLLVTIVW
jgi:hypothetical protein